MKSLIKKIIGPISISVLSCSCIVGTSFALFTDQASTSIEVTSGIVDVDASIKNLKVYSAKGDSSGTLIDENGATYVYEEQANLQFVNGGTASIDGTTLSLARITPGDKVAANFEIKNTSNVKSKYRVSIYIDEDDFLLGSALNITFDGVKRAALGSYTSDWTTIEPQAETSYSRIIPFEIELPIDKGNVYQNEECHYKFSIEAVQANATVAGEEKFCQIESESLALSAFEVTNTKDLGGNTVTTLNVAKNIETASPMEANKSVTVSLPNGAKLDPNASSLTLVVAESETNGNFAVSSGEQLDSSFRLDVKGLSNDNEAPISVSLPYTTDSDPTKIVHLKDDGTKETIYPYSATNPNGFVYSNGYITFTTATFSDFFVVRDYTKIYFANTPNWTDVYAYLYTDGAGEKAAWPGEKITANKLATKNRKGEDVYYLNPDGYQKVIFHNGNGKQTVNITLAAGYQYWTTYSYESYGTVYFEIGAHNYSAAFNNVYFTNNKGWNNLHAYMWIDETHGMTWPGVGMSPVREDEYGHEIYSINVGSYKKIIFNDNGGTNEQTIDIDIQPGYLYFLDNKGYDNKWNVGVTPFLDDYFETITDAVNSAQSGETIKLLDNVSIQSTFAIGDNKALTIDLNGHNITYEGTSKNIITVDEGATLNLIDSNPKTQYGKWNAAGTHYDISTTSFEGAREFTGGIISGGIGIYDLQPYVYNVESGGAIINKGTLNITGVNIAGNSVAGNTGGISNVGGVVNFNSGQISDNKAVNGSGSAVYNDLGTFNMNGGTIAGNIATRGAIIVRGATFNLNAGVIENNTCYQYMIDVTPHPTGAYGVVNMNGGTIRNNVTTNSRGGAFFVRSGCTLEMNDGEISGNTTAHWVAKNNPGDYVYDGGAVAAGEYGIIKLKGGAIKNNIGGGVYAGDLGNTIEVGGDIYIYDNWFDEVDGIRLDLFMEAWRGQCPNLVLTLTGDAKIGLYEGHFLNDPDTYGCLLRVKDGVDISDVFSRPRLVSNRDADLKYQEGCYSNVNYWGGLNYIRQYRA